MQAERDWLVKRVFPALRQRFEQYRIHLVDIDLRWGITREQAKNDQVLGLCLQQIDECRPFFLGLLGGRYGWVPLKFPVEVGMRYGWTQAHTDKSITELEILHGVLNDPTMHGRALFCFRYDRFLEAIDDEQQRRIYVEGPTDEELRELGPDEAERRARKRFNQLKELKQCIRKLAPTMSLFDGYPCQWNQTMLDPVSKTLGRLDGLREFGDWVIEKLEHAILNAPELQEHLTAGRTETRDELAEERDFHDRFIENRTRLYIGRQKLQDDLKAFVTGGDTTPCLLTGPSGSGKSAAMAKFVRGWREQHPEDVIISHFVGASPRSTDLHGMLRHLCMTIKNVLNIDGEIKQDLRELSDQFREIFVKVPSDRRIVVLIDALNQLDETKSAHSLFWLPQKIPQKVRFIVSCLDDPDQQDQPVLSAMLSRQPHKIEVGDLTLKERLGIMREIPSVAAKTLDEEEIKQLLNNEAIRNPLFLLVALEEQRGFGSFEQLKQRIIALPRTGDTLTAIFQQVIRRLCEEFHAPTVKDVFTLLACSRCGLSERELLDLIEGEGVFIEDSEGDLFPILRQLRSYLQMCGQLLNFFHQHLHKAVHEEFFKADENLQLAIHGKMADYFKKHADPLKDRSWKSEGARQLLELPFHLGRSDAESLVQLLFDFNWMQAKTDHSQVHELLQDYNEALRIVESNHPQRLAIELVQGALQLSAHVVAEDRSQLASQIVGRMSKFLEPGISQLLETAKAWRDLPWLMPLNANLTPPGTALLFAFRDHPFGVDFVAITPDDKSVVSSSGKDLRVWDLQTGILLHAMSGHAESMRLLCLPTNEHSFLSVGDDGIIRQWDLQTGTLLCTLPTEANIITALAVLPDCSRVFVGDEQGKIYEYELITGYLVRRYFGHANQIDSLLVDPCTKHLISGSRDCRIRIWDLQTGLCRRILTGHTGFVMGLAVLPDGNTLVSGSMDKSIRIWNLQKGTETRSIGIHGVVYSLDIDGSGRWLIAGTEHPLDISPTVRLFDLHVLVGNEEIAVMHGHTSFVGSVAITSDGRRGVSGSYDGTVLVWNLNTASIADTLEPADGMNDQISALAFSQKKDIISSGDFSGQICMWNTPVGEKACWTAGHNRARILALAFSPDGEFVTSIDSNGWMHRWKIESKKAVFSKKLFECAEFPDTTVFNEASADEIDEILGEPTVALSDDGSIAIVAERDGLLKIWEAERGSLRAVHHAMHGRPSAVAVDAHGGVAAVATCVGSGHSRIYLWNLTRNELVRSWDVPTKRVLSIGLSPMCDRLVLSLFEGGSTLWDIRKKHVKELYHYQHVGGHLKMAANWLFAGSSSLIASCTDSQLVAAFTVDSFIESVITSSDGDAVVIGEESGRIHILKLVLPDTPLEFVDTRLKLPYAPLCQ